MVRTRRSSARGTDLSRALLALRERAGHSQARVAEASGLPQSVISRIESARAIPSSEQLTALLDGLNATPAERREIGKLAASTPENVPVRVVLERGVASFQQRIYDIEEDALLVRSFHPTTILGILQTEPYIKAVFKDHAGGVEAAAKRLERHRLLLDGSDRRWVLLQAEGALRWNYVGAKAMAAQMDAISEVIESCDRIRVGIIPSMREVNVQPLHGFHIYNFAEKTYRRDVLMAQVGTHSGTALLREHDAAQYVRMFESLEQAAIYGDEARLLVDGIADEYRRLL